MPIRLVLADDHPLVLDALEEVFRRESGECIIACRPEIICPAASPATDLTG
jgi:DNA-binding NarL/FixJ family response regulator